MPVPAYILAGGQSRRFGSDKARAELRGEPLITRLSRQLEEFASEIIIVADRPDKYQNLGLTTIADRLPGQGPLGGLETALAHTLDQHGPGWILLASCDLVEIQANWIQELTPDTNDKHRARAFRNDIWHPFPGLYHTDVMTIVQEYLASPKASCQRLLSDPRTKTIPLPLPANWPVVPQVNTPEELERLKRED